MPYGMYLLNPGKKRRSRKARRARRFAAKNPMKTRRRKSRRRSKPFSSQNPSRRVRRRRRSFARRNPARKRRAALKHVLFLNPSMKTRRRSRRRRFAARNPMRSRRRRHFSFRNPSGAIQAVLNKETMTLGAGVVLGNVGTGMILNKLLLPGADGKIPLALPGVDTTKPNYMGSIAVSFYKLAIGGAIGYFVSKKSARLGEGIIIGAVAGALSDVIKTSNVLASIPGGSAALGVGRYFPGRRGAGAYVPGVPPIFTGPASAFIPGGSPGARVNGMPRRNGTGTMVTRRSAAGAVSAVQDPFGNG